MRLPKTGNIHLYTDLTSRSYMITLIHNLLLIKYLPLKNNKYLQIK